MFRVLRIFFSPTGGTRRITAAVSDAFVGDETEVTDLDLTYPRPGFGQLYVEADLALIGVPVYYGRVAQTAAERFSFIRCREMPAVLIACYGNRAYEDSLLELKEMAESCGFLPCAAAAFVAEHSFSDAQHPVARKRPDSEDIETAKTFGLRLREQLVEKPTSRNLILPGRKPFKPYPETLRIAPVSLDSSCGQCGVCIRACPVGAIRFGHPPLTDPDRCIQCCACIKACPGQNRVWKDPWIDTMKQKLVANCLERNEPEFFMNTR